MLILVKNYFIANRTVLAWTSLPMTVLVGMVFLIEHAVVLPLVIFALVYISTISQTEERNRTDALYCSLPVKKSTVVYSRYLAALFTFVGVATVCFLVFSFIESLELLNRPVIFPPISGSQLFTVTILVALFVAGVFPFFFKYGFTKGLLLGAVAILLVSAVFIGILYAVISMKGKTTLLEVVMANTELPWIFRFSTGVFIQVGVLMGKLNFQLLIGIMTIILVLVSVRASLKLYDNKDL
ncbi:MAG: ABC-2 transporter permease [Candidatus Aminicenantes bacterium]|nr:MAG: ABC-2 transporter permease [Candidatus Aminicenantes bacterium]